MDLELLEDYILNRLSAEEEDAVRDRLETDPIFAAQYGNLKILSETVRRTETREKIKAIQKEKLSEWQKAKVIEFKPKRNSFKSIYKFGGVAIAACLIAMLYLGNAAFDLPAVPSSAERGQAETTGNEVFQQYITAQDNLRNGNFAEAASQLGQLKSNAQLRAYFQDAAQWYEVVATTEIDEAKANILFAELENDKSFKYPIPWLEKLKMKVRLLF